MSRYVHYVLITFFMLILLPVGLQALKPQQWHAAAESAIPTSWQAALDTRIADIANQPLFATRIDRFLRLLSDAFAVTGLSFEEHRSLVHQVRQGVLTQLKEEKVRLENDVSISDRSLCRETLIALITTLDTLDLTTEIRFKQAAQVIVDHIHAAQKTRITTMVGEMLPVHSLASTAKMVTAMPEKSFKKGAIALACLAAAGIVIAWSAAQNATQAISPGSVVISLSKYESYCEKESYVQQIKDLWPLLKAADGQQLELYVCDKDATDAVVTVLLQIGMRLQKSCRDGLYKIVQNTSSAA